VFLFALLMRLASVAFGSSIWRAYQLMSMMFVTTPEIVSRGREVNIGIWTTVIFVKWKNAILAVTVLMSVIV
jgi:hypothetical protein